MIWIVVILLCGVIGRTITRRLDANLFFLGVYVSMKEWEIENIAEDIIGIILGPLYLLATMVAIGMRKLCGE